MNFKVDECDKLIEHYIKDITNDEKAISEFIKNVSQKVLTCQNYKKISMFYTFVEILEKYQRIFGEL